MCAATSYCGREGRQAGRRAGRRGGGLIRGSRRGAFALAAPPRRLPPTALERQAASPLSRACCQIAPAACPAGPAAPAPAPRSPPGAPRWRPSPAAGRQRATGQQHARQCQLAGSAVPPMLCHTRPTWSAAAASSTSRATASSGGSAQGPPLQVAPLNSSAWACRCESVGGGGEGVSEHSCLPCVRGCCLKAHTGGQVAEEREDASSTAATPPTHLQLQQQGLRVGARKLLRPAGLTRAGRKAQGVARGGRQGLCLLLPGSHPGRVHAASLGCAHLSPSPSSFSIRAGSIRGKSGSGMPAEGAQRGGTGGGRGRSGG